jgi:hypothetical protein
MVGGIVRISRFARVLAASAVLVVAAIGASASAASGSQAGQTRATFDQVHGWAKHYAASHSGKDRDINAKSQDQLRSDPAAKRLVSICGKNQRPVIPILAWEYGGSDHPWINPDASALAYCVYTPVRRNASHWRYSSSKQHVTADVYLLFPGRNPCRNESGRQQVMACLGDPSNIEILVDTASLNDGANAGLDLSEASTTLRLIEPNGRKVTLVDEQ